MEVIEQILMLLLAAGVGFSGKLLWDKIEGKNLFMTEARCEGNRNACCVQDLKKEFIKFKTDDGRHDATNDGKISVLEDKVQEDREDIKIIKANLVDIQTKLARLLAIVEERWGSKV